MRSFTLSPAAADILCEDLKFNLRQFPFEIPHVGATVEERARTRTEVWADLRHRKLADSEGTDPEVYQALRLLHASKVRVSVTAMEVPSEDVLRAGVAVSGRSGVLAIQEPERVRIDYIDPRGLARICTDLLPDVPAGRLESATLSTASGQPRGGDGGSVLGSAGVTASSRAGGADMRKAQRILALPVRRIGYFFVVGRDERGQQVRQPAVGWRDTDQGRYSVTTRRNNDGAAWNTFAGADKQRLAGYLGDQLRSFEDH